MKNTNQIRINTAEETFICLPCNNRRFKTELALLQHCRKSTSHQSEWCERCKHLFTSQNARSAHMQHSNRHWLCSLCSNDLTSKASLMAHNETVHTYCTECEVVYENLVTHRIASHHRCEVCNKEFDNKVNRIMHSQIHLPRSHACCACKRTFKSNSGILIHLQSGSCDSGIACEEIDKWAFQCYQSAQYTNDWADDYKYQCPICETNFEYVSGLLQHVESPACMASYGGCIGKLKRYIEVRAGRFATDTDSQSS